MSCSYRAPRNGVAAVVLMLCASAASPALAEDIEQAPIRYATAPVDNVVSRLLSRIEAGKTELTREEGFGYVRSLLRELRVPESSQVLVFSKTSLQRQRIGPRTPRAIYFNDDVYVGFCRHGDVAEISAVDPRLGTVFYTLDQRAAAKPKLTRQTDACLICHGSSQNEGFPGHLMRSVYPDAEGYPELAAGTYRIDQRSPLKERWGGWYVTGSAGGQPHLGNRIARDRANPRRLDDEPARELADLRPLIDTSAYLTPHSDIAALMVLEHQTEMHNLIARAVLQTRLALHQEKELNREMANPVDYRFESTSRRIRSAGDALLQYMLFAGEPRLSARIEGTSSFAREFVRQGPRDSLGRSLRDLNLTSRLFSYPCSYLIYSSAFDALPQPVHDYVLERLWDVLTGKYSGAEFAHLSPVDRKAILQILRETKSGLPKYWYAAG